MRFRLRDAVCIAVVLSGVSVAAGCGASRQETVTDPRGPAGKPLALLSVPSEVAAGLSGATTDDDGRLWLVPEERRVLVHLDPADGSIETVPLRGIDEHFDTESIASLGQGRFALGTETAKDDRAADPILFGRLRRGQARIEHEVRCPYDLWQIEGESNEGIEGLCFASGHLVMALELVEKTDDGRRYAPLAAYDVREEEWTSYRMELTSDTGKVSALACRADGAGIDVLVIERHFEVSRLLRLSLPSEGGDVSPEPLLDLLELTDSEANFEGLAWLPTGDVAIAQDNHYGEITTPASAVVVLPARLIDD